MQKRLWGEAKSEATLIDRYFAAKAFEKTTGDMSEPMGEFTLETEGRELMSSPIISWKSGSSRERGRYTVDQNDECSQADTPLCFMNHVGPTHPDSIPDS
jgi:hypothetical protein